jgi:anthranilate phosphoribosyltransferase
MGVYDSAHIEQLAWALGALGLTAAWVVHGHGGLDEISPAGPTRVAELVEGEVRVTEISPSDFGLPEVPLEALRGGDAQRNATIIREVFSGEKSPARVAVLLNAAAALRVAGAAEDTRAAAEQAAEVIDSGAARETLERWAEFTRSL